MYGTSRGDASSNPHSEMDYSSPGCLGGHRKWEWTGNPKKRLVFYIVSAIIIILLISFLIATVELKKRKCEAPPKQEVCLTRECVIAANMIRSMDFSVDPCEDFYNFTCGNYNNDRFPDLIPYANKFLDLQYNIYDELEAIFNEPSVVETPQYVNITKKIYTTCLNPQSLKYDSLFALIKELHEWPVLKGDKWNDEGLKWDKRVTEALSTVGIPSLFLLGIDMDQKNTSRNTLYFLHPGNQLDAPINETIRSIIKEFSSNITNQTLLEDDIDKMIQLQEEIQSFFNQADNALNAEDMKIKDLGNISTEVDWVDLLKTVVPDITEEDTVSVANKDYLIYLFNNLTQRLSEREVQNYVAWRVFLTFASVLPTSSGNNIIDLSGRFNIENNKKIGCMAAVLKTGFKIVANYMFLKGKTFSDDKVDKMIKNLRNAFRILAEKANWIDKETLSRVFVKLDAMREVTKPPANVTSEKFLEAHFSSMTGLSENDVLGSIIAVRKYIQNISDYQLHQRNTLDNFLLTLDNTGVNAFYVPFKNAIVFPITIQREPFFSSSRPWYLNFGSIGMVIGHEITHGFDSSGRTRDKDGNLKNWWSEESEKKFKERAKCFIDQYNKYYIPGTNVKQNGTQTLAENIADNGGLRQAYLAYKNWIADNGEELKLPGLQDYSQEQLFFIGFGTTWCTKGLTNVTFPLAMKDSHSPERNRVIGALSNFDEFSKAFQCKENSRMNPKNKCVIW